MLPDLPGCKRMYYNEVLCVSRAARGRRLATGLATRSLTVARELGCDFYATVPTGAYSQAVFANLGMEVYDLNLSF